MAANSSPLQGLAQARGLALENPALYTKILPGILPFIGSNSALDLRTWGAAFLAETFASPVLPQDDKQALSLQVLPLLKEYLDAPDQDLAVVKSAVQASATIYPLVFRYIVNNPSDVVQWQTMIAIKSNILRRMDTAVPGLRVCCIKFVQQVVQTQTPGVIADPRRSENNEASLALVPRDHPLLPPSNLEAEASGLLDRILSILQDNSCDALLVTATLNSLGSLVRLRATIANKIINTVLGFNPFKLANAPMTPTSKVQIRSMERTTRALLHNFLKKSPHHPLAVRVHQYIERLQHTRVEVFAEFNRKRPAPAEPTDCLDPAKRQRISPDLPGAPQHQALEFPPAGPVSFAQLFKLTDGPESSDFDVRGIPHNLVIRILIPMLQSIDRAQLDAAINVVRARYLTLTAAQNQVNNRIPLDVPAPEDEDDYEPEYVPTEDEEQIRNRMEMEAEVDGPVQAPVATLGTFKLGPAPLLARQAVERINATALGHLQARMETGGVAVKGPGSSHQRSVPYLAFIQRLASRLCIGLELDDSGGDEEVEGKERGGGKNLRKRDSGGGGGVNGVAVAKTTAATSFADMIRQRILLYVLQDWRRRIDVAISWLTEEWVADLAIERMNARKRRENDDGRSTNGKQQDQTFTTGMSVGGNYRKWLHKLLDELAAFIGSEPSEIKVLVRLLSEIPAIDVSVVEKVKRLALDPERVPLVIPSLRFLVMFRPPVREIALDAVEDMWRNYDGAKGLASKDLGKWRPQVLKESQHSDGIPEVKVES